MASTQHKPMLALTEHMQPVNIIKQNEEVISFLIFLHPISAQAHIHRRLDGLRDESSSICKKMWAKICTCLSIRPDIVFQVFYLNKRSFPGDWGRGGFSII